MKKPPKSPKGEVARLQRLAFARYDKAAVIKHDSGFFYLGNQQQNIHLAFVASHPPMFAQQVRGLIVGANKLPLDLISK